MSNQDEAIVKLSMVLFDKLGIGSIPEKMKRELLESIGLQIHSAVVRKILTQLGPEKASELDSLVEKGEEQAINNFLTENTPNLEQMYAQETTALVEDLKDEIPIIKEMALRQLEQLK